MYTAALVARVTGALAMPVKKDAACPMTEIKSSEARS